MPELLAKTWTTEGSKDERVGNTERMDQSQEAEGLRSYVHRQVEKKMKKKKKSLPMDTCANYRYDSRPDLDKCGLTLDSVMTKRQD
jgi:hypothetical protein